MSDAFVQFVPALYEFVDQMVAGGQKRRPVLRIHQRCRSGDVHRSPLDIRTQQCERFAGAVRAPLNRPKLVCHVGTRWTGFEKCSRTSRSESRSRTVIVRFLWAAKRRAASASRAGFLK